MYHEILVVEEGEFPSSEDAQRQWLVEHTSWESDLAGQDGSVASQDIRAWHIDFLRRVNVAREEIGNPFAAQLEATTVRFGRNFALLSFELPISEIGEELARRAVRERRLRLVDLCEAGA